MKMASSNLPPNHSHQQLMGDESSDGVTTDSVPSVNSVTEEEKNWRTVSAAQWITVAILCYVNLINYMDRYTMAGIMSDIRKYFDLNDKQAGLLQTVFVISYMIFAPIFGYLGDRYSRRFIMAGGVFLWSLTTLLGSFMESYVGFIAFRACVGIGEASYSTIAPTIISDLFVKDLRAKMLALFYFAIPVGSGLGYIVGAKTAFAAGAWQWALRVTPVLGAIAVLLILVGIVDPPRGANEGHQHLAATSWTADLKYLLNNRSFMLSTMGFVCVSFVAGALAWWGPDFISRGVKLNNGNNYITEDDVSFTFGLLTMLAGIVGVPLGTVVSQKLRVMTGGKADPIVCGVGLLASAPIFFAAMKVTADKPLVAYVLVFFASLLLNLNWAIVADILLYVVIPTRRSTAEAFQILISHAFGDAGSPYLIGCITDWITTSYSLSPDNRMSKNEISYYSLQYALFSTCFIEVIGGLFFLITAAYIVRDKMAADGINRGLNIGAITLVPGELSMAILPGEREPLNKENELQRRTDEFVRRRTTSLSLDNSSVN